MLSTGHSQGVGPGPTPVPEAHPPDSSARTCILVHVLVPDHARGEGPTLVPTQGPEAGHTLPEGGTKEVGGRVVCHHSQTGNVIKGIGQVFIYVEGH